jgi:hypothetical protein
MQLTTDLIVMLAIVALIAFVIGYALRDTRRARRDWRDARFDRRIRRMGYGKSN